MVYPTILSPLTIYTPGWRETIWSKVFLPKKTSRRLIPGLEPDGSYFHCFRMELEFGNAGLKLILEIKRTRETLSAHRKCAVEILDIDNFSGGNSLLCNFNL